MVPNRRILVGCLCIAIAIAIIVAMRIRVEQISLEQQDFTFDQATLHFETDRSQVWQEGDCVTLRWHAENIASITWSKGATIPTNSAQWCLDNQVSIPVFTIQLQNGKEVSLVPFALYTTRIPLFIVLLP